MTNMYLVPLLDFDLSDLAGKKINYAQLEMTSLNEMKSLAVDVSTISEQWNEKYCSYYNSDNGKPWVINGWLSDVIMSGGNSIYFREKVNYDRKTKKTTIEISPKIIQAMATEQSFGFSLMDVQSEFYGEPNDCFSKKMSFSADPELGEVPKLTIIYEEYEKSVPNHVNNLKALAIDESQALFDAAVQLNWTLDSEYCENAHYNIYMSERSCDIKDMTLVGRYFTPILGEKIAGTTIEGLSSNTEYYFAVEISNGIDKSLPQYTSAKTLNKRELPILNRTKLENYECSEKIYSVNSFSVGVTDDLIKINPINGEAYNFGGNKTIWNNGIFSAGKISLCCVKGEKMGFQLAVISKEMNSDFTIKIEGEHKEVVKIYKEWCVKIDDNWYPDVTIPIIDGNFSIPFVENNIPIQKELTLFIDIDIKEHIPTGLLDLSIIINSGREEGGEEVIIPVVIDVANIVLPRSEFIVELNGYVYLPKCAGYSEQDGYELCKKVEREYYRIGYEHYGTINILPYSHTGKVQPGFAPEIGIVNGEMHVVDWSKWDEHFEQYLDGSYIQSTEVKKVPITHIYLPFHENWPMPINDYYKITVKTSDYPDNISEQLQQVTDIYSDFKEGYREGIKSILKDFILHFEEKNWKNIDFQYFFNNKLFYKQKGVHDDFPYGDGLAKWLGIHTTGNDGEGTSWWLLDEPHFRKDWEAIAFYATILREAQAETNAGKQIKFRADLSCFNQAYDFLDGLLDINVVGGRFADCREEVLHKRNRIFNEKFWPYGSWNSISSDNINNVLWIIDIYLKGSHGIIPWYSFGLDLNYEEPDDLAVIYPGKRFGLDTALASTRLKSGRKAMEIIKYFDAFKRAFGYSNKQLKQYVSLFLSLSRNSVFTSSIDAGTAVYADTQNSIEEMKRDMLKKLIIRERIR